VDYSQWAKNRSKEMYPGANGRLQTEWQLTDTKLADVVKLTAPPAHTIPIIFVPGIMGSNLCDLDNRPVWLLNSIKGAPIGLALTWAKKRAGERQTILHPERTKVYAGGAVPKQHSPHGYTEAHYRNRGWGEVSEASYHKFLLWLDEKMNLERNPANWPDFSHSSLPEASTVAEKITKKLPPGFVMRMSELPSIAEAGYAVEPITSNDLIKRSKSNFPIYGFGYNWLASNQDAAKSLKARIEKIISENNIGSIKCSQVILVTHSMGGLVARACSQLPLMAEKILGIVHGVMPATGAAVAYRRCKVGMRDEDLAAGLVIGADGREVTAVFAQSPGALQLLPSEGYGSNWLEVSDPLGKRLISLPTADPYKEIYLEREKWWGLIREEWLRPEGGTPISWDIFAMNIGFAKDFHRSLAGKYHPKTYVFYGGGDAKKSFSKIRWKIANGSLSNSSDARPVLTDILNMTHRELRTDGSNNLYVGGERTIRTTARADAPTVIAVEASHWEVRCEAYDAPGDGTVPVRSGKDPRKRGGANILQQFALSGVQHEPAYRDYPIAQQVAYYSITKLAALADLK
jgi:pimeloyl-ACP methyl ester carboxylesterase